MDAYFIQKIQHEAADLIVFLKSEQATVALAESCTGGLVAALLTDISGSSDVLLESVVTYSNESKHSRLGVSTEITESFGAVSKECVHAMATGLWQNLKPSVALSISGIAGPTGGTDDKPVGSVCFGVTNGTITETEIKHFAGNRDSIRYQAAYHAFKMIKTHVVIGGK